MERETRTIKTPAGNDLVLKTYLTARERNSLRAVYLSGMKIDPTAGDSAIKEIDGSLLEVAEHKLVDLAVVSYNGSTDVLNTLLDGKPEEYDFVVEQAGKLNSSLTGAK